MDDPSVLPDKPRKTLIDRFLAFFEILLMSGLLSSSIATSIFPEGSFELLNKNAESVSYFLLLETGITFLLLIILTNAHRETAFSLGLHFRQWKSNFLMGLVLVPFLFMVNTAVTLVFRRYFPDYYIERNPLTEIIQTPYQLVLFIISAIIAGGIKEELQRAFILNRFSRYLGGAAVGLLLWSAAFGAQHYLQGWQGIIITTICGFTFGIAYLLSKSLIGPIVAHSIYDTLALLLYWFSSGQLKQP